MESETDNSKHSDFLRRFAEDYRRLYRFVLSLTFNHVDADDVMQDTSVVLWKKYDDFDPSIGTFYAWACRVAYLEVMRLRRQQRRAATVGDDVIELLRDELARRADATNQREHALMSCLKKLPPEDRQLVEDRYFSALAPKELAAHYQRSVHSVYRSLARVHGLLRRCVDRSLA